MLRVRSSRIIANSSSEEFSGEIDIDGAKIVAVRTSTSSASEASELVDLLDLGDRLVTPAFVNSHTHCALSSLRGRVGDATAGNVVEDLFYRFESKLTAKDVRAFARMGAWENLLNGVGLVWDHYFFGEALAEGIRDTGLSAVVAPTLQDLGGPGAGRYPSELQATETLHGSADPGLFVALGAHAPDTVSDDLWQRIFEASKQLGVPVHSHLAQSLEEVERLKERSGKLPYSHLLDLGAGEVEALFAHALYVRDEELQRASERHHLVWCPYAALLFGFPARPDHWARAGASWTIATDCAASNDSFNVAKELRLAAGGRTLGVSFGSEYQRFLSGNTDASSVQSHRDETYADIPFDCSARGLLHHVWEGAGSLHAGFRAGEIAPGALANLAVWDTHSPVFWPAENPLRSIVFGDVSSALTSVFVAGKRIGDERPLSSFLAGLPEYRAHREEASARLEEVLERIS